MSLGVSRAAMVLLAAALFSAGCTARHAAREPALAGPYTFRIALATRPASPQQMDETRFFVQIADTHHRPVSGAAVSVQLAMPAMDMGRNTVALHETATPGTYTGTGRFTMPGDWQAAVSADLGTRHQSQTFPISVR